MNSVAKILIISCILCISAKAHEYEVVASRTEKTPLYICYVMHNHVDQYTFPLDLFIKDLMFLDIFRIKSEKTDSVLNKKDRSSLLENGYGLGIFIIESDKYIDMYIHDLSADKTIIGKRIEKNRIARYLGHKAADIVVSHLLSHESFFLTKVAYVKEALNNSNSSSHGRMLCVADYDGSSEQIVNEKSLPIFGTRWSDQSNKPMLFYSEHTKSNIRLMAIDQSKKKHICASGDGITMLPASFPGGNRIIYCATGTNGYTQLFLYTIEGTKQITFYEGNSLSPSITADGKNVYFCSDFQTGHPQIYLYMLDENKVEKITQDGYCTSPSVSLKSGKVAYTRMIKGLMQLMIYNPHNKTHVQLTFDEGNKDCPSWSPCGTNIMYGFDNGIQQRIGILNIVTHKNRFITPAHVKCSYPAWSPVYKQFPIFI